MSTLVAAGRCWCDGWNADVDVGEDVVVDDVVVVVVVAARIASPSSCTLTVFRFPLSSSYCNRSSE